MIQLLALDVDGTLVGEDLTIAPIVQRTVDEALRRDVTVTLATGRMFDATLPFAQDLNIKAPLICYQGGLIQSPDADRPIYRAAMDSTLMQDVLAWCARRQRHPVLYAGDEVFVAERRYPRHFYESLLGKRLNWVSDLPRVLERHEPVKFLVVAEPAEADHVEVEMRQRFEGQMEVVRSHAMFVEGNPPGVSKGNALQRLSDHLEIPQAQVMAIGDQGNDVTMIAWAGLGVAMGNGSPAVKAVADWVAPPLAADGAAVAINRFVLDTP